MSWNYQEMEREEKNKMFCKETSKAIRERAFKKETIAYGKMIRHCYIEMNNIQLLNRTDYILKAIEHTKCIKLACELFSL